MILNAIKSGLNQLWSNKRMVLIYYLVNLLLGIVLMLPFRAALSQFVGHRLMGEKLAGTLDMDFVFEFIKENSHLFSSFAILLFFVFIVYGLLSLFLSGGAFSILASNEKYAPPLFWGEAARYFGRFFRLVLWSIPVAGILFCLQFLWSAIQNIFFGSDPYQYITYWGSWIKVGLRHISLILFFIILDYARIQAVLSDDRRMRICLWQGIKFAFNNFFNTFGLALLLFIAGMIALVIYNPVANLLHTSSWLVILSLFIWQQLYMVFRMFIKLALYAGEVSLYRLISL